MKIREYSAKVKREADVYRRVWRDPRTPKRAKLLLGLAVGYLAMPFDLIPDFIPVLGQLDDLLIIPLLIYLAVRFTPGEVIAEHRESVRKQAEQNEKRT
jgi:uncharacterized membrane protein YkvA (DUF1232 family)